MTNGRLTGVLMGVLVICLVAGGVGAFLLGRQDAVQAAGQLSTGEVGPPTGPDTAPAEITAPSVPGESRASSGGQEPAITTDEPPPPASSDSGSVPGTNRGDEDSVGAGSTAGNTNGSQDPAGSDDADTTDSAENGGGQGGSGSDGETNGSIGDTPDNPTVTPGESSATGDADGTTTDQTPETAPGPSGASEEDKLVRIGPEVLEHDQAADIRGLAQAYFDAINAHSFADWQTTVTPEEADSTDEAAWTDAYSTTEDSFMEIVAIDDDPLRARVTFISRQDPAKAANDKDCTRWAITLPVIEQDGSALVFGRSVEGEAQAGDCAG